MFNLNRDGFSRSDIQVKKLLSIPHALRDEKWKEYFVSFAADAIFAINSDMLVGPDNFPYFQLYSPPAGDFQGFTINFLMRDFILREGVGVVINPAAENGPDFFLVMATLLIYLLMAYFFRKDLVLK